MVDGLGRALACVERGWAVHPVEVTADGRKLPRGLWKQMATTDPRRIEAYWREWPDSEPGVVLTNELRVVDLDDPDGAAYRRLAKMLDPFPWVPTRREGGRHWYFEAPQAGGKVPNKSKDGLELRGAGQYVVCWNLPPLPLAPLPEALVRWAGKPPSPPDRSIYGGMNHARLQQSAETQVRLASGGERNRTLFRWALALSRAGALTLEGSERLARAYAGNAVEGEDEESRYREAMNTIGSAWTIVEDET